MSSPFPSYHGLESLAEPRLSTTLPVLLALILGTTLLAWVSLRSQKRSISGVPVLGTELGSVRERKRVFFENAGSLLQQGYERFPQGLFQVSTDEGPCVIVSGKFVEELKSKSDDVVSFTKRGEKTMMPEYTGCSSQNDLGVHVVKSDLTANLNPVTLITNDEVERSLAREFQTSTEWRSVNVFSKMLRVVSIVSGRVFCEDLCGNEEWTDITIGYTMNVFNGALALKKWHPWTRPFIYMLFPRIRKIHAMKRRAVEMLSPVILSRISSQTGKIDPEKSRMDMLQWLTEKSVFDEGKPDLVHITDLELILGFASIHSNTGTLTNILYDLVARPEYFEPLRNEIMEVLKNNGQVFSRRACDQMWKLDSFMKESMRFTPTNLTMFKRTIMQDIQLSNGALLPAGTLIDVPAGPIARDSNIVPGGNANEFDGYRYYRLRQEASREDAAKYLFATVSVDGGMHFGYGRRACPGRFFTTNLMKLVLAHLILENDIKMPDGESERYPNLKSEATNFVDPSKNLLFRKFKQSIMK